MPTASSILDPIAPEKALLALPLRAQYDDYLTGTELLTDGNMEAADTSAWTAYASATLSKQTGGVDGGRCLRCAGNATAGVAQVAVTASKRYRIAGSVRTDGTSTTSVWCGDSAQVFSWNSTSWKTFTADVTAVGSTRMWPCYISGASGYVEADNFSIKELVRVTSNLGKATGAPAWVQCGDGYTAGTFPTQLTNRRGVYASTTSYLTILNSSASSAFDFTGFSSFTIAAMMNANVVTTATRLISHQNGGTTGYYIDHSSTGLQAYALGTGNTSATYVGRVAKRWTHVTAVYDGSRAQIRLYVDGVVSPNVGSYPTAGMTSANVNFQLSNTNWGSACAAYWQSVYLFPYALGDAQVYALAQRARATMNMR